MARIAAGKTDKEWQASYDLDTLMQAEKIKADPARLKAAKACAEKRKKELADQIGQVAKVEGSDKD